MKTRFLAIIRGNVAQRHFSSIPQTSPFKFCEIWITKCEPELFLELWINSFINSTNFTISGFNAEPFQ